MFGIFNLNQTLASNSSADPDDTLNTKRALSSLGYYATPSYGMTKYPDEGLFDGIKTFQKDNDLTKDGVMKPEGETATQLGKTLAERRAADNPLRAVKADTEEQEATPWPSPFPKKPMAQAPTSTPSTPLIKPTPPKPLQKAVGRKQPNRAGDVGTAIGQLIGKGIYAFRNRQQDAVVKNAGLEDAIIAFQETNGLKVDAVMKPGGETEQALLKVPGDQHPPSAPETPTDPGQDDPDEPNDIKPKPPGDQHPPSAPDKPDEDDDIFSGPCRDLGWKSYEANQALYEARQKVSANDQDIENITQEIAELKDEHVKDSADDYMLPDRIQDTRESSPKDIAVGIGRRSPIARLLTIAEIAAKASKKTKNNAESREEIAKLEAELKSLEEKVVPLRDLEKKATAASDKAADELRACLAKYE